MTKQTYNASHVQRSQQIEKTHTRTKALHDAAEEALKCHEKYMSAMEKLMNCILDNSDCMEEMRKDLGEAGEHVTPTYEVTGTLASAFNSFKTSVQVKKLRDELYRLTDVSTIAKRNSKVARAKMEELDAAAKKYAKYTAADYQQKVAQADGKKKEKLLKEQKAEAVRVDKMDAAVVDSMKSLCTWWAEKLAVSSEEVYKSCREVGTYAATCFEDASQPSAPPPSSFQQPVVCQAVSPFFAVNGGVVAREDASSYVGVSDYLSTPPSSQQRYQLGVQPAQKCPCTVSPDDTHLSNMPPALYPSATKSDPPAVSTPVVSAPPNEDTVANFPPSALFATYSRGAGSV